MTSVETNIFLFVKFFPLQLYSVNGRLQFGISVHFMEEID